MIDTRIDASALVRRMTELEKRQLPFALAQALNDTAFEVRQGWQDEMSRVFDRPTPTTLRAVVYEKATKETLVAQVALKGSPGVGKFVDPRFGTPAYASDFAGFQIPPVKYLQWQVRGGARRPKRSEVLLRNAHVIGPNDFIVPSITADLDEFGGLKRGVIQTVLSDLQATFDPLARSTSESRRKRSRRKDVSRRARYFVGGKGRAKHLPRGIFESVRTASGWMLNMVMAIVRQPQYQPTYDVFSMAQRIWDQRFPANFAAHMKRAMRSAR